MVDAMCERSPEFFVPFQKNFKFFITDSGPSFPKTNTKNFDYALQEKNLIFVKTLLFTTMFS